MGLLWRIKQFINCKVLNSCEELAFYKALIKEMLADRLMGGRGVGGGGCKSNELGSIFLEGQNQGSLFWGS